MSNPFNLSDEQLSSYREQGIILLDDNDVTGDFVDISTLPGYGSKPAAEVLQDYINSKKNE